MDQASRSALTYAYRVQDSVSAARPFRRLSCAQMVILKTEMGEPLMGSNRCQSSETVLFPTGFLS